MTKKAKERQRRRAERPSLGYTGWKYKTEELTFPLMRAEVGILESDTILGHKMTDRQVRGALEALILTMRARSQAPLEEAMRVDTGNHFELVADRIRDNWEDFFRTHPQPTRDELIGILRTILGSVEQRSSANPASRNYLIYLAKFLGQMGARVTKAPMTPRAENTAGPSQDSPPPPPQEGTEGGAAVS